MKTKLQTAWTAGPMRRAGMAEPSGSNGRTIRYLLSDSSIARDGHTIATAGWSLANYLKNPIVQWAHSLDEPPIGRMAELGIIGDRLMGTVEYADAETYPFADTIYRLARGGYLNAVSVSWAPIEWKYSQDRARPGGIDFLRTELLEVSQVPLPAAPDALATARAAGIDTGPLYEWAEKVLDTRGDDPELIALRKAARMPTPKTKPAAEPPVNVHIHAMDGHDVECMLASKPPPKQHILFGSGKRAEAAPEPPVVVESPIAALVRQVGEAAAAAPPALQRGLYTAGWFLMLLDDLFMGAQAVMREEAREGDPSPAPAAILSAANYLAQAVLGYVSEQISEAGAGADADELDGVYMMAAPAAERRAMLPKLLFFADAPAAPPETHVVSVRVDGSQLRFDIQERQGRVISADTEAKMRDGLDQVTRGTDTIRALFEVVEAAVEAAAEDMNEVARALGMEALAQLRPPAA